MARQVNKAPGGERGAGKGKAADSPVMLQYRAAKAGHPDALLFFRLGDFYELFFEDAVVAARVLDLTLTSRNKGAADEIPMAGVPYHAASGYLQRLLEAGYKVALCEQMADPKTVKGIVPREVVRVVTPSLVFDELGLDPRKNAYLVAVSEPSEDGRVGVAALDASTGELLACEAEGTDAAAAEVARLDPREVLVPAASAALAERLRGVLPRAHLRVVDAPVDAATELAQVLGPEELARSEAPPTARAAAAEAVRYARACEPGRALPVRRLVAYALGERLVLDEAAQRHLELTTTLDGETRGALVPELDRTLTAPGARLFRARLLAPLASVAPVRRRLDDVERFVRAPAPRAAVRAHLARTADLERIVTRLALGRAGPRDLAALRATLAELPPLVAALRETPAELGAAPELAPAAVLAAAARVRALLDAALADEPPAKLAEGGVVRAGHDAELDEARALATGGQRHLVELEARLRDSSQIGSLKVRFTRVFGWYLEVTRAHVGKAPAAWRRKQTVATGERFSCDELDELADKLAHAEERASQREAAVFAALVAAAVAEEPCLREVAAALAELDVATALAELAHAEGYVRPDVDDSLALEIDDGRHPVVERLVAAGRFVPNDARLDAGDGDGASAALWTITGPNMAGKSTFMRQVALVVLLAQAGSFVPARRARVGLVDRILTRVGASDALARGDSTFMVEMKETAGVLRRATRRSLVVLDEIGRGTSTYDGLSIAWAVAEHLVDAIGCRALFATHYHELTRLADERPRVRNMSVAAREHDGHIVFFHRVAEGAASRSYGVACARLAGLPEPVLARARMLLEQLEGGDGPGAATAAPAEKTPGRRRAGAAETAAPAPQLGLFAPAREEPPALRLLREVDLDRTTPLEALLLLQSLKALASRGRDG